jgi:hypothetical protein
MPITTTTLSSRLIRLQLGQESTWGTGATGTAILNGLDGLPTITPKLADMIFDEQRGSLVPSYSVAQIVTGGMVDMKGFVTYEDILYILCAAYGAPTPVNAAPLYTWTFAIPTTATFTPVVYTMELGALAATTAGKLTGCTLTDWTIAGDQQKEMSFTAKFFGKTFTPSITPTGALGYRTTEIALTPSCTFAMDPAATAAGTTPYTATLVNFTLTGNTGLAPFYTAGAKSPSAYTHGKQTLGLKVALAYASALDTALVSNLLAGKTAVFQIKAVSGTHSIEMDFVGALKSDPVFFGDSQGAQIVELDMDAVYDATDTYYTKFVVANAVSALP